MKLFDKNRFIQRSQEDIYFINGLKQLSDWKPVKLPQFDDVPQVIDMFCGCGGMTLGFAALSIASKGLEIIGGIDINKISLSTYHKNFQVPALQIDIRELANSKKLLAKTLKSFPRFDPKRKTILIGCAPCQGFSSHRKKNWDSPDQRNSLIEHFTEIAINMQPECIVMENVPELLSEKYWHHFEYFKSNMENNGYIVKQSIHNAANQGVPQERFRSLIIAMRQDFSFPQERLSRENFLTVRDAIGELPSIVAGQQCKFDLMHKSAGHRQSTIDVIKAVPLNGGSRPKGIGPKCLQDFKGYADVYGRLKWDKPAITITHYARNPASGRFVHPQQHRGLTMREAARLQSFPDGFEFLGGFDDVFRQIGEAVPPLLSLAIAASILANLRNESQIDHSNLILSPVNNSFSSVIAGIKGSR